MGRPLFPAAAMLETALAAWACMDADASAGGRSLRHLIAGMSIAAPIILPAALGSPGTPGTPGTAGLTLRCTVEPAAGHFWLSHAAAGFSTDILNATGAISLPVESPSAAPAAADRQPRSWQSGRVFPPALLPPAGQPVGRVSIIGHWEVMDGFILPPNVVDSALHLGVTNPAAGAKIPVAVGGSEAAAGGSGVFHLGNFWAGTTSAVALPEAGPGASKADFLLAAVAGSGACGTVSGLETRVTKLLAASPGEKAPVRFGIASHLYEVERGQVSHPGSYPGSLSLMGSQPSPLSISQGRSACSATLSGAHPAHISVHATKARAAGRSAAVVLSILQSVAAMGEDGDSRDSGRSLHFLMGSQNSSTSSSGTGPQCSQPGQGGVWAGIQGLLRTAASEAIGSSLVLSASLTDERSYPSERNRGPVFGLPNALVSGLPDGTVLGAGIASAGAVLVPKLLPSRRLAPEGLHFQIRPFPRGSLASMMQVPYSVPEQRELKPNEVIVSVR